MTRTFSIRKAEKGALQRVAPRNLHVDSYSWGLTNHTQQKIPQGVEEITCRAENDARNSADLGDF